MLGVFGGTITKPVRLGQSELGRWRALKSEREGGAAIRSHAWAVVGSMFFSTVQALGSPGSLTV